MEKYNLKWNDFQINVSKSLSSLRKENDFFDVTLVSDDEQHLSAHKVVLSASSEFFKNILKKANHTNPLIYLSGVDFKNLSFIMDYIYQGEVQLFQKDLDNFLDTAQKLKIDGLIGGKEEDSNQDLYASEIENTLKSEYSTEVVEEEKDSKFRKASHPTEVDRALVVNPEVEDQTKAADKLVEKVDGVWHCKQCGKTTRQSIDFKRHAETHIEGLSFECPICHQTFRSSAALKQHNYKIGRAHV